METTIQDVTLALRMLERHRAIQREGYYRHKEKRQAYAKARYAQKLAEQGIQVRPGRGRPPKNQTPPTSLQNECVAVE
jgi:hypothetical protein